MSKTVEPMHILVNRDISDDKATLSIVSLNGAQECYAVEDEFRTVKVKGETRIPAGTYKVGVRKEGRFHARFSTKYAAFHKGMLHVLNVPGFEYILIHTGNSEKDTDGCLCVGQTRDKKTMTVGSSQLAYEAFYKKVIGAALAGKLTIEYQDNDKKKPEAKKDASSST